MIELELYKNSTLSAEQRAEDLLSRMTLVEKLGQLGSVIVNDLVDDNNKIVPAKLDNILKSGCGHISRSAWMLGEIEIEDATKLINQIQDYLKHSTRLGIPAILHEECLNGVQARHATVFPQSIGVASTWNEDTVLSMGDCLRKQLRAKGATQGLAPVLDVVRDPRWGRTEETYGEDPYLISSIGAAYVKGMQGNDLKDGVIATAKHFLGYGASEGGMNQAPTHITARELREVYGLPFEAIIKEADLGSIMNSYTEIDGVPCTVSRELLTEILRNEFHFNGIVVSDYGAIDTVVTYHHAAKDMKDGAIKAIYAGMDMELPFTTCYGDPLMEAVKEGKVKEEVINPSVLRILTKKFQLGLFDKVIVDTEKLPEVYKAKENKEIAAKVARESIVLLKNNNNILPLSKQLNSLAIVGPNADSVRNMLGDYNYASNLEGQVGMFESFSRKEDEELDIEKVLDVCRHYEAFVLPSIVKATGIEYKKIDEVPLDILIPLMPELQEERTRDTQKKLKKSIQFMREQGINGMVKSCTDIISLKEAIDAYLPSETVIRYAKGCEVNGGTKDGFQEAIDAVSVSEVAIVVMGDKSGLDKGSTSGEARDRADLNLPGYQLELLQELKKTGTPLVLVLINGRPLSTVWENEHLDAIIEAWLPGEEGAQAVTEVLFGDYNPGGRLPISVPKTVGQVPVFYNHKPSGGRSHWHDNYVEIDTKPLFEFGYGLSYTTFDYTNFNIDKTEASTHESVTVSVTVKNTGTCKGDEVVQIYLQDIEGSVTRPVKQLFGFKRLTLEPGQQASVSFELPVDILGFYDENMDYVVEAGKIAVFIGASSNDIREQGEFVIVGADKTVITDKVFFSKAETLLL
ncbi:Periplasmic beta-glucosidase precursor [compost metagenome]